MFNHWLFQIQFKLLTVHVETKSISGDEKIILPKATPPTDKVPTSTHKEVHLPHTKALFFFFKDEAHSRGADRLSIPSRSPISTPKEQTTVETL